MNEESLEPTAVDADYLDHTAQGEVIFFPGLLPVSVLSGFLTRSFGELRYVTALAWLP